jgi:hypothetical protein
MFRSVDWKEREFQIKSGETLPLRHQECDLLSSPWFSLSWLAVITHFLEEELGTTWEASKVPLLGTEVLRLGLLGSTDLHRNIFT